MKTKLNSIVRIGRLTLALWLFVLFVGDAAAADLKLEAQLVWATNEPKSPNPKHKPVDTDVRKKLNSLPLKWSHYFEENRKRFDVPPDKSKWVDLSDKCAVEVKNLNRNKVEVCLIGKGKPVWRGTQSMPQNEILVLGGNAPDDSAWLVTLKRLE
jgi:hypothetical protein